MRTIGIITNIKKRFRNETVRTVLKLMTDEGNSFYSFNGKIYQSDLVMSCIRPKANAVGKLTVKHIRNTYDKETHEVNGFKINPEPYIKFLLEEPNPYMSMQKLLEKVTIHLALNSNAFILIVRDENGYPKELYPLPATAVTTTTTNNSLYLKFYFNSGKTFTFPYTDIIHLRTNFNNNELFGDSISNSLLPLMEVVTTIDQGIVHAVKNSAVLRWILKFNTIVHDDDKEKIAEDFASSFLDITKGAGAAVVDSRADAIPVNNTEYIPNASQMDRTTTRIRDLFNTNGKIVRSEFTENEWIAYFEAEIQPVIIDLQNGFSQKLFSRKERGFGNSIILDNVDLSVASMQTKISLLGAVDRGSMTINEWRRIMNLPPVPGGDRFILRKDTAVVGGENE